MIYYWKHIFNCPLCDVRRGSFCEEGKRLRRMYVLGGVRG